MTGGAAKPADAPDCPGAGLSPWPTTPAAIESATARLREAFGPGIAPHTLPDAPLQSLGSVAAALVEREAAGAPQPVKDEAVIRFAAYLAQTQVPKVVTQVEFVGAGPGVNGPHSAEYVTNHSAAFRHCGAKAMLSPWRVRRAGVIG